MYIGKSIICVFLFCDSLSLSGQNNRQETDTLTYQSKTDKTSIVPIWLSDAFAGTLRGSFNQLLRNDSKAKVNYSLYPTMNGIRFTLNF
jgi:hypothetical protein